jgi:hypothetical protein
VPPAHFASAQAKKVPWQEFLDHGASLNWALNEALRIHGGPAWRIFQVSDFSPGFVVFSLYFFRVCTPPDPCLLSPCPSAARFGASGQEGRTVRTGHADCPACCRGLFAPAPRTIRP